MRGGYCSRCNKPILDSTLVMLFAINTRTVPHTLEHLFMLHYDLTCLKNYGNLRKGACANFGGDGLHWVIIGDIDFERQLQSLDICYVNQSDRVREAIAEARDLLQIRDNLRLNALFEGRRPFMTGVRTISSEKLTASVIAAELKKLTANVVTCYPVAESYYKDTINVLFRRKGGYDQAVCLPTSVARGIVTLGHEYGRLCTEVFSAVQHKPIATDICHQLELLVQSNGLHNATVNSIAALQTLKTLQPKLRRKKDCEAYFRDTAAVMVSSSVRKSRRV